MFEVREAGASDVASLSHVHTEGWRSAGFVHLTDAGFVSFSEDEIEKALATRCTEERWAQFVGDSTVLLALSDGAAGGVLQLVCHDDGRGEIVRMYLLPEFWGTGMAQVLIAEAFERARSMGIRDLILFSANSPRARRFYEKCGFEATGNFHDVALIDDVIVRDYEYVMTL
jgi:GNAT superfamily N-acetyltransferase